MAKIATQTQSKNGAKRTLSQEGTYGPDAHSQIASLAYQFYADRGYQNGFDEEDWLRAERTLKAKRA